jgi:DNA-directed RNA polymerase subunit RPC12/RpoP
MFRRRGRRIGHVWPPLRPWARSPMDDHARQDLQRANRLMEIGDFTNAALLYEKLARKVHDLVRPRQAAHLYVQAARGRILAGQVQPGLELLEQGLSTFAQAGLWEAFERVGSRVVDELRQQNQPQAAQDLFKWMETMRTNHPPSITQVESKESPHRELPLKCPSCGATVRPDEVEWVDEDRAACEYCGSMLAA